MCVGDAQFALDTLPEQLAFIARVAEAIVSATSAEKKAEIASWAPEAPRVSKVSVLASDWPITRLTIF